MAAMISEVQRSESSIAPNTRRMSLRGEHNTGQPFSNDHELHDMAPTTTVEHPITQALSRASIVINMSSLCLSVTLSALDLTIITTALPAIVSDFGSDAGYTWIGSSFILAYTAIVPIWGSLADIWGRKPIILCALVTFMVGSLICAVVKQLDAFIVGRVVQGLGAAGMGVIVNVIICDMFSVRDRGLYLAITSIIWAVGSAVGPVLGGVFTSELNWRWCFWINLPIGGLVILVLGMFLKLPNPRTPIRAGLRVIDWTGSLLVVGGVLMILLGLNFGGITHPWASPTVISLITFGCAVIGIFGVNEWKLAINPIVPLRLFSSLSTVAAYAVFACDAYVFMGMSYYLPLYSQSVLGATALTSGVYLVPPIVACSLAAAAGGLYIQKSGRYLPVMYIGQALMTLGVGLFTLLKPERDLWKLFGFEIIAGVGVGLNIDAPILAAQAVAPARDTAAVTATMGLIRSIFTAISVVIGGVVFQNRMNAENSSLVEQLGVDKAGMFTGAHASVNVDRIRDLPGDEQMIVRQAYHGAMRMAWVMYVAFSGLAMALIFLIRAHYLSKENQETVLGTDRISRNTGPTTGTNDERPQSERTRA